MSHEGKTNTEQTLIERFSRATVVGLGATGYSAVRYLCARGLAVTVVDSRDNPPLKAELAEHFPEVNAQYGTLDIDAVTEAALIVASPGVNARIGALQQAKSNGAVVVGDIALFVQESNAPLIAITGSNGKSTVTTLVGKLCVAAGKRPLVAGNIGKPALDALTDQEPFDIAVLELSSFQLETTPVVPAQAAAILNVSEDHMDRYTSMGDYVLAKARILRGAERAVLPRHDEQLQQITRVNELISFGLDEPSTDREYGVKREKSGRWLMKGRERIMLLRDVPLIGLHNVSNVLSAFALVDSLHIPADDLAATVRNFEGLAHRMQTVAVKAGVTWVNDSKATNIGAAATALQSIEGDVIWLAGGEGKGADFSELKPVLSSSIKLAVLFGTDAPTIEKAIGGAVPVRHVCSLEEAVNVANQVATEGAVVLLSPACASFDMFSSFEHRGQVFTQAVNGLAVNGLIGTPQRGNSEVTQ